MKVIGKKEYESLNFKNRFGDKANRFAPFEVAIKSLALDEAVVIEKSEWPYRVTVSTAMYQKLNGSRKNYVTRTLADDSGWVVKRVR